jgi:hypothetical protein
VSLRGEVDLPSDYNTIELVSPDQISGSFSNAIQKFSVNQTEWDVFTDGPNIHYRRWFVKDLSRFTPKYFKAYSLAENVNMPLYAVVQGIREKAKLRDYKMVINVPSYMTIRAAQGYYANSREGYPVTVKSDAGKTSNRKQYSLVFGRPVNYVKKLTVFQIINIILYPGPEGTHKREYDEIHYWAEAEKGRVIEMVHTMPVRILPFKRVIPPKKIYAHIWSSQESNLPKPHREALLKTYHDAGFSDVLWTDPSTERSIGLTNTWQIHLDQHHIDIKAYIKEHPSYLAGDGQGNYASQRGYLCPEIIRTKARSMIKDKLMRAFEARKYPNHIGWDYEVPPLKWRNGKYAYTCFCDRCQKRFKQMYGISPSQKITAVNKIIAQYEDQWIEFRCLQAAETAEVMSEAIQEVNQRRPKKIKFNIYTGYGSRAKRKYGWDWRYADAQFAKSRGIDNLVIDYVMCGYSSDKRLIQETLNLTKRNDLVGGVIIGNYGLENQKPVKPVNHAEIIQKILYGGNVLLYSWKNLTGKSIVEAAKALEFVSRYEGFITDGKKSFDDIRIRNHKHLTAAAYAWRGKHLAVIVNTGGESLRSDVYLKAGLKDESSLEYFSQKTIPMIKNFETTIPPRSVYAFEF